jgi:hypothetical protein
VHVNVTWGRKRAAWLLEATGNFKLIVGKLLSIGMAGSWRNVFGNTCIVKCCLWPPWKRSANSQLRNKPWSVTFKLTSIVINFLVISLASLCGVYLHRYIVYFQIDTVHLTIMRFTKRIFNYHHQLVLCGSVYVVQNPEVENAWRTVEELARWQIHHIIFKSFIMFVQQHF